MIYKMIVIKFGERNKLDWRTGGVPDSRQNDVLDLTENTTFIKSFYHISNLIFGLISTIERTNQGVNKGRD